MKVTTAFCPSHITGLFVIHEDVKPAKSGSRGAGVSLQKGVYTRVKAVKDSKWRNNIRIDGRLTEAPVSSTVIQEFSHLTRNPHDVLVEHRVEVPIGSGYGVSGATALSLALGLNEVLDVGLTNVEAAQIAHLAEIKNKTGLGTVLAETFGGVEIREKPGAPGVGSVKQIRAPKRKVVSLFVGPLLTKKFLVDPEVKRRVNTAGIQCLKGLMKKPKVENFLMQSRRFSDTLNLYTSTLRKILKDLDTSDGHIFTMNMFGEAVFTLAKDDEVKHVVECLWKYEKLGSKVIVSDINQSGAALVE